MKKIIFTLAIICAMMVSCSSNKVTESNDTDSVIEMVDTVSIDTVVEDSVL